MQILDDLCIGCGTCLIYCPSGAIGLENDVATINTESCVECGTCVRVRCCPTEAIQPSSLKGTPREIRSFFSDPAITHGQTSVPGRGTEEVKTNDVTGRFKKGYVGIGVEVGRPSLGAYMEDVERITTPLASMGIRVESNNPLAHLLESRETGRIKEQYRRERVTSIIIEFTVPESRVEEVLLRLKNLFDEGETTFTLDLITHFDEAGNIPMWSRLVDLGYTPRPNAKINLGLGRPLAEERDRETPGGGLGI